MKKLQGLKKKYFAKPLSYYVGTGLMFLGALLLLFIYVPLVRIYFFTSEVVIADQVSSSPRLYVPKIGVDVPVILGVDASNPSEYLQVLQHGVAHAESTALPGDGGTSFLFAHSSDVPWRVTQYNTAFYRLGELELDDQITVDIDGKRFQYQVVSRREVWPDEVEYLTQDQGDVLILQTCTPVGTALKRLLVFAEPLSK